MAGSVTSSPVDLDLTAGLPYARRFRVGGVAAIWPTEDSYEVRSQIRAGRDVTSTLLFDLATHMTAHIDGADIVVDISMTGAQTRLLPPKGYYDIVISDPGVDDARAIQASHGKIKVGQLVTAAVDV